MIIEWRKATKDKYHLINSSDGTELFLRDWTANNPSKIAFVIFHGITAHSEPYRIIGERIAQMGFTAYGFDLRGHGLSSGKRGDFKSTEQLQKDLAALINFLQSRHQNIICIGHSLGVVVATIVANSFPQFISGLILLSAARKVKKDAYPKRSIVTKLKILFWSVIRPSKPVIHYYREGIRGLDDPRFNFHYTLRFLKVLNPRLVIFPESLKYPVLVAVGDQDELFAETDVKEFYREIPAETKQFIIMPDTRHAYFNDKGLDDIFQWIKMNFI